ncbi:hypothetical protein EE612_049997, partial [Oryza sativa]
PLLPPLPLLGLQALVPPRLRPGLPPPLPLPRPPPPSSPPRLLPQLLQRPLLRPHRASPRPRPRRGLLPPPPPRPLALPRLPRRARAPRLAVLGVPPPHGLGPTLRRALLRGAALLCDAGECHRPTPFRVVFAFIDQRRRPCACVYSSLSGEWGEVVCGRTVIPHDLDLGLGLRHLDESISGEKISAIDMKPPVLVGNVLYWLLVENCILEFNMDAKSLAVNVISGPDLMYFLAPNWSLQIMLAEGGSKLGFGAVKFLYLKLWVRKSDSDSTASWVMRKRIKLCMFIPPPHPPLRQLEALFDRLIAWSGLLGFTEDGSVAFLQTPNGVIMLQLDTMEFKLVLPMERLHWVYPHSSFYLTDGCII